MVKRVTKRFCLLAIIISVSIWLLACAPPQRSSLPFQPHQNPEAIPVVYDNLSLLRYAVKAVDLAVAGEAQEIERMQQNLSFATMRPEAAKAARQFFLSLSATSSHAVALRSDLETTVSLAKQYRRADAKEQASTILQKLPQALTDLDELEKSTSSLRMVTGAFRLVAEAGDLRFAYREVTQRQTKLTEPLKALVELARNKDVDALVAKLIALPAPSNLQPTELSLELAPRKAFVGDVVRFWGNLTSREIALPGRNITLEVKGRDNIMVRTGLNGYYRGELKLPYKYGNSIAMQAHYLPRAGDVGVYFAAASPVIQLESESPLYPSRLELYAPARAYLGLGATIRGRFDSTGPPLPGTRPIDILVDGSSAGSAMVGEEFRIQLEGEQELTPGKHQIRVVASGWEGYGPASAEIYPNVAKAIPVVDLKTPRLALVPLSLNISGKVESEVAPLNAARLKLKFGSKEAKVATAADGTFSYRLSPGFLSSLAGWQGLEIEVVPSEPWNDTVSTTKNIAVFNPGVMAFLLVVVIAVNYQVRLRRRARRGAEPAFGARSPVLATETASGSSRATVAQAQRQEDRLLQIFRGVVGFIVSSLGIIIRPHLTLREIVTELAPRLGAMSSHLWRLTLIVERLIYSRHAPTNKDKEDAEKLSAQLTESMRHEAR